MQNLPPFGMNQAPTLNLILQQCLIEILGEEDFKQIWSAQMDAELFALKSVRQLLAAKYGEKSADGILFSLGRNFFTQILVWLGQDAGFSQKEFQTATITQEDPGRDGKSGCCVSR